MQNLVVIFLSRLIFFSLLKVTSLSWAVNLLIVFSYDLIAMIILVLPLLPLLVVLYFIDYPVFDDLNDFF